MFTTGHEVERWVNNRLKFGIKPGLKRMEWMLERLGNPERHIKTIHVGGTNGKGSTTTYIRSILQSAGYEVGTFTSPYVECFNERISVNGIPIQDADLIEAANVIKPLSEELEKTDLGIPTEFETITAMGLYYFAKIHPVDFVIVEVGLGGRLDSTNVIHPIISVITNISLDHTHILGSTVEEIAFEKAGIIKNGVPVVTGVRQESAWNVIKEQAKLKKSKVYTMNKDFFVEDLGPIQNGESFSFSSVFKYHSHLEVSMLGRHQIENAGLAVMVAQLLYTYFGVIIEEKHIQEGLKHAYWPGRFEILSQNPTIIMDGAHNEEGMRSFIDTLRRHYPDAFGTILFTAMKDKALDRMVQLLDETSMNLVFTNFDYPRAANSKELYELSHTKNKEIEEDWKLFLNNKIPTLQPEELLIVTGSLYFISNVKPFILEFFRKKQK